MKQQINDLLKISALNNSIKAPEESWDFITNALHKKKKKRFYILFFSSIMIAIILCGIFLLQKNNIITNNGAEPAMARNNKSPEVIIENFNNKLKDEEESNNNLTINKIKINELKDAKIEMQENFQQEIKDKTKKRILISKSLSTASEIISTNNTHETLTAKNNYNRNFEQKLKIKISAPEQTIEINEIENNNIDENLEEVTQKNEQDSFGNTKQINTELVNLREKEIDAEIKNEIIDTNIYTKNVLVKLKQKQTKDFTIQVSYGSIYINKNHFFGIFNNTFQAENAIADNLFTTASPATAAATRQSNFQSNFLKGKSFSAGIFLSKKISKRTKIQAGINVSANTFYTKAYDATPVNIRNVNKAFLISQNTSSTNSNYSSTFTYTGTTFPEVKIIKNKLYNIGLILGAKYKILQLNKANSLQIQTQINPSFIWYNKIYLHSTSNKRYFLNKNLITNFMVNQSFTILLNNEKRKINIGPVYSFTYNKVNKKFSDLQNIFVSSFGIQLQYTFGSKK